MHDGFAPFERTLGELGQILKAAIRAPHSTASLGAGCYCRGQVEDDVNPLPVGQTEAGLRRSPGSYAICTLEQFNFAVFRPI